MSAIAEKGGGTFQGIKLLLCENPLPPIDEAIVDDLNSHNDAYPLARPSQAAAIATLRHEDAIRARAAQLRAWTADKTVSRLKAAGFLLLPPCRGEVGMGVEILIVLMLSFYPLPTPPPPPPPARGRE